MENNTDLDQTDFDDWLKNPITSLIREGFEKSLEIIKDQILFSDLNDNQLIRKIAYNRGSLDIVNEFLNLTFEQIFKKEEEEKSDEIEKTPYAW